MIAQAEEATPVSAWQAVVATPITDELLEWPADLFALTDVILARSEVYRWPLVWSNRFPPKSFRRIMELRAEWRRLSPTKNKKC